MIARIHVGARGQSKTFSGASTGLRRMAQPGAAPRLVDKDLDQQRDIDVGFACAALARLREPLQRCLVVPACFAAKPHASRDRGCPARVGELTAECESAFELNDRRVVFLALPGLAEHGTGPGPKRAPAQLIDQFQAVVQPSIRFAQLVRRHQPLSNQAKRPDLEAAISRALRCAVPPKVDGPALPRTRSAWPPHGPRQRRSGPPAPGL